jgi:F0F1-type ATP synthase assembly protein I
VDKAASNKTKEKNSIWLVLSLAWQLGYIIAIPLIFLALLGRFLDKCLNTSPWFFLVGILLAIIISTFAIYFKTVKILKETESEKSKK